MNLVLIHIGSDIPPYMIDCVEQARKFYDGNLFAIMPQRSLEIHKDQFHAHNCSVFSVEELLGHDVCIEFFKKSSLLTGDFWTFTFQRLFLLQSLIDQYGLEDVVHIENDVLIYEDIQKLLISFRECYSDSVAITPVGPDHDSAALIYVHKVENLGKMNDALLRLMGEDRAKLVRLTKQDMISEMTLLRLLHGQDPGIVQYLPILPEGEFSTNVDKFDCIFDGASWGQYMGGTPNGSLGPGMGLPHHWIGREIVAKRHDVIWNLIGGKRIPHVRDNLTGKMHKICNLHIHCKRLKEFM